MMRGGKEKGMRAEPATGIDPCYVFYLTTYDYALPRLAAARLDGSSVLELHWRATSGEGDERAVMSLLENGAYVPTAIVHAESPADAALFLNPIRRPIADTEMLTFLADDRAGRTRNALPGDLVCAGQQVWMMTAQGMRCLSGIGANDVFEAANGWLFERSTEEDADIEVLDLLR